MIQDKQQLLKGSLISALGFIFIAVNNLWVKLLNHSIPIIEIIFIQSVFCLLMLMPIFFKYGISHLKTKHPMKHVIRGCVGLAVFLTLYSSLKTLPLVNATLLFNTGPIWLPFIVLIWLRIRLRPDLWWGIIAGFIGVLLILHPTPGNFFHIGSFLALLSGLLMGFLMLFIRRMSSTEPPTRILFYYCIMSALISLPFTIHYWAPLNEKQWLLLFLIGISFWLSQSFVTLSYRYAKASVLAPISYVSVIVAGLFDWLVWHHVPSKLTCFGIILVIAGGILTLYFERKSEAAIEKAKG